MFPVKIGCFCPLSHSSGLITAIAPLPPVLVNKKSEHERKSTSARLPSVDPPAHLLLQDFRGSLCQSHQTYCLNYSAAVFYLESLRRRDDFGIYLKVKYPFSFLLNFSCNSLDVKGTRNYYTQIKWKPRKINYEQYILTTVCVPGKYIVHCTLRNYISCTSGNIISFNIPPEILAGA